MPVLILLRTWAEIFGDVYVLGGDHDLGGDYGLGQRVVGLGLS